MSCKIEKRCLTLPRNGNTILNKGYYCYFSPPHKFLNYEENDFLPIFAIVCLPASNRSNPQNPPVIPTPCPTYMGGVMC